jgi:prepilin-type N-terminal cleavage/methylation domain-containing protein
MQNAKHKMKNRRGFTLVELALVMVVIGLLFGGIIKGQEMIKNARVKRFSAEQRSLAEAIYAYYDKYSYYPGDDPNAFAKWSLLTVSANGNGNGLIANTTVSTTPVWNCSAAGQEQCNLWGVLRQAGFLSGSLFASARHVFKGPIAVTYYTLPAWGTANAFLTHWIVYQDIPNDVCQALDSQYDDGNWQTGNIRGSTVYTTSGNLILYYRL